MSGKQDESFTLRVPEGSAEEIVADVRAKVKEKQSAGLYRGDEAAEAATLDFEQPLGEEDFLVHHLKVIQRLSEINFGDFKIVSKGGVLGPVKALVPKLIWKLLRFYTFRLFSQQRDFNVQASEALISYHRWSREEIDRLNGEIERLREELKAHRETT